MAFFFFFFGQEKSFSFKVFFILKKELREVELANSVSIDGVFNFNFKKFSLLNGSVEWLVGADVALIILCFVHNFLIFFVHKMQDQLPLDDIKTRKKTFKQSEVAPQTRVVNGVGITYTRLSFYLLVDLNSYLNLYYFFPLNGCG